MTEAWLPSPEPMRISCGITMLRSQYLAGFKYRSYPTVDASEERSEPTFDGCLADLERLHPGLSEVLWNDVKLCKCGKPCACVLKACNGCGNSLAETPPSKSENVFSAFLFGVKSAAKGFPYKISLRRQTPEAIVFDDMLSLTPCHLNGISAKYYIRDWRFLLTNPKEGLKVLDTIEMELWAATLKFLRNPKFKKKLLKEDLSDEELWGKVIKSFNFPPSQFQMHIQWQLPPLLPFQHYMAEIRNHFHEGRAFPLEYVRKVLLLNEPCRITNDTPIEDIVRYFDKRGVVYQDYWRAFYHKAIKDSIDTANWHPDDFEYVVEAGKVYKVSVQHGRVVKGDHVPEADPLAIQKSDCLLLQNYGRPYIDGKPSGTYVRRALQAKIGHGGYQMFPSLFD